LQMERDLSRVVSRFRWRRDHKIFNRFAEIVTDDDVVARLKEDREYQEYMYDLVQSEREEEDYDWYDERSNRPCDDYEYDTYDDWNDYDNDPMTTDQRWRDLWVAGHVHDDSVREIEDSLPCGCCDHDEVVREMEDSLPCGCCDHDEVGDDIDVSLPRDAAVRVDLPRRIEKLRAGDRYYRATGRTVTK